MTTTNGGADPFPTDPARVLADAVSVDWRKVNEGDRLSLLTDEGVTSVRVDDKRTDSEGRLMVTVSVFPPDRDLFAYFEAPES